MEIGTWSWCVPCSFAAVVAGSRTRPLLGAGNCINCWCSGRHRVLLGAFWRGDAGLGAGRPRVRGFGSTFRAGRAGPPAWVWQMSHKGLDARYRALTRWADISPSYSGNARATRRQLTPWPACAGRRRRRRRQRRRGEKASDSGALTQASSSAIFFHRKLRGKGESKYSVASASGTTAARDRKPLGVCQGEVEEGSSRTGSCRGRPARRCPTRPTACPRHGPGACWQKALPGPPSVPPGLVHPPPGLCEGFSAFPRVPHGAPG